MEIFRETKNNQKGFIATFKSRIKTWDRPGRFPVRVFDKIFQKQFKKEWSEFIDDFINNIKVLVENNSEEIIKNINKISINNENVTVETENSKSLIVYTDVYSFSDRTGKNKEPLKAKKMSDLSLDHDLPIACLYDLSVNLMPHLKELNDCYSQYLDKNGKTKKSVSDFYNVFVKRNDVEWVRGLFDEVRALFKTGDVTIMQHSYNVRKNDSFLICEHFVGCDKSKYIEIKDKFEENLILFANK